MRTRCRPIDVARVDDNKPSPGVEQVAHVSLERRGIDQVKDDVNRKGSVGDKYLTVVNEGLGVIDEEALGRIISELRHAAKNGRFGDIESHVTWVARQLKLIAVPASELHHRFNVVAGDEFVQDLRLVLSELA